MKHIFIFNPTAGSGRAERFYGTLDRVCKEEKIEYDIIKTKYEGHTTDIAKEYRYTDDVRIYAVGGDGTVNEVINGLNDNMPFSIIPIGTGNDFYRMIQPEIGNIEKILVETIHGKMIEVDYIISNHKKVINTINIGFDSRINHLVEKIKKWKIKLPKSLVYPLGTLLSILFPKPFNVEIEYDGKIYRDNVLTVGVFNGKYYGHGIRVLKDVNITDNYIDIMIIKNRKLFKMLSEVKNFFKLGAEESIDDLVLLRAKNVKIKTDIVYEAQHDGENFTSNYIECKVAPGELKMYVPKYSNI